MCKSRLLVMFLGAATVLTACLFDDKEAKRGSVVDNELRVGRLQLADGSPAVNARVRIFPVEHRPDSGSAPGEVYSGLTDSAGEYVFDSLPKGEYNVLAKLGEAYSYQDSLYLTPATDSIPLATLGDAGSITGIVGMQPQHDPRTALVQVLGTERFANVDKSGRFRLSGLAGGEYTLRLSTTELQYTSLITGIKVRAGRDDSLADTLELIYTGIPVVKGLKATYDTSRGIVNLTWNPVDYANLSEYQILRDPASALDPGLLSVGRTSDTSFADSLVRRGILNPDDSLPLELEYRVRAKNKSDFPGPVYGYIKVSAAGPAQIKTRIQLEYRRARWNPLLQVDSTDILAKLSNPNRGLQEITWRIGSKTAAPVTRTLGNRMAVTDSLRFGWADPGSYWIYVEAKDEGGTLWLDSLKIQGNAAPILSGSPVTQVSANLTYAFNPTAMDSDGDELLFSGDNLPVWMKLDSTSGRLEGSPTNAHAGVYPDIAIRVSDGRRSDTLSFKLTVAGNPWKTMKPMPFEQLGAGAVNLNGKIFVFGGDLIMTYDVASEAWTRQDHEMRQSYGLPLSAQAVNGMIYVFNLPSSGGTPSIARAFDPQTMGWSDLPDPPKTTAAAITALAGGKIYLMLGQTSVNMQHSNVNEAFDPVGNAWTLKTPVPYFNHEASAAAVDGKIYVMGGRIEGTNTAEAKVWRFDPQADTWSPRSPMLNDRFGSSACTLNGIIYSFSGWGSGRMISAVEAYDPVADTWADRTDMPEPLFRHTCVEAAGKIHCFGGQDAKGKLSRAHYEYDPAFEK